jgi:hypothetical protein
MSMTIYFKNGETLHISGQGGEELKQDVGEMIAGERAISSFLTIRDDKTGKVIMVLNIDEVACIR